MAQQHKKKQKPSLTRSCGLVRAVPSGDTLTILDLSDTRANTTAVKEIQLTLIGLKAPAFGRKTVKDGKVQQEADQDWAFESREFLRQLVIGKCIVYLVEHEAGDRHYGEVWLNDENLRFSIVREGWADVIAKTTRKGKDGNDAEPNEEYLELMELKESAEKQGLGKWQKDSKKARSISYRDAVRGNDDALFSFFEKYRGKPLPGIVEQVRSGSTLRVLLLTKTMDNIPLLLSGIRCPTYKFNDELGCEPFSREAKFITEHYLLHRDVTVTIDGFDNYNNFFGTVVDREGRNICSALLQMGLATFVEWTAPKNQAVVKQFRDLEKQAQDSKLRIWSLKSQSKSQPQGAKGGKPGPSTKQQPQQEGKQESFTAKVVEIVNGGTIVVRLEGKGGERTINFASIMVPRTLTKKEEDNFAKKKAAATKDEDILKLKEEELENKWQSAYAAEAKELLRSRLIGEDVKCELDYTRAGFTPQNSQGALPPREFWTVTHKGQNIAVDLVQRGFAKVVRHAADEPRSRSYQDLVIAEKNAQKSSKGLHGTKTMPQAVHKTDLTERDSTAAGPAADAEAEGEAEDEGEGEKKKSVSSPAATKAQAYLGGLQRAGKLNGVVEFVFSGSRFKVWIPSQSIVVFFSLAGVQTSRAPENKGPADKNKALSDEAKWANQARSFVRDRVFQRNVEVTIFNADKGGNFLGSLVVNKVDIGLKLVEEGLARIQSRSLDKIINKKDYLEGQKAAQKAKKGIWVNYNEEAENAAREERKKAYNQSSSSATSADAAEGATGKNRFEIAVTEIIDGATFCYQVIGNDTKLLADMMTQFQSTNWESQPAHTPVEKEVVSAKFSQDGHWYRAQVTKVNAGPTYDLTFIDYGNVETTGPQSIRKLLPDFEEKIVKRQAKTGRLAYIVPPKLTDEFGKDAAAYFKNLVWGKNLTASLYSDRDGNSALVVGDPQNNITINGALVSEGLARTEKRRNPNAFVQALKQEEDNARKQHLNIWQYGDIPDSDDEM